MKKLTKAQKELLAMMRDGAYITASEYLYKDGRQIKSIRSNWMWQLKPFFVKETVPVAGYVRFVLRSDAELTDEWLQAELAREQQARDNEKAAKRAAEDAEIAAAAAWFNEGIDSNSPYTLSFFRGLGEILFNGEALASFRPTTDSGADRTFEAVLSRPENLERFEQIKRMVNHANRGAASDAAGKEGRG